MGWGGSMGELGAMGEMGETHTGRGGGMEEAGGAAEAVVFSRKNRVQQGEPWGGSRRC